MIGPYSTAPSVLANMKTYTWPEPEDIKSALMTYPLESLQLKTIAYCVGSIWDTSQLTSRLGSTSP